MAQGCIIWSGGGLNGFFQVCEDAFSTVRRRLPCKRLLTFIVASFTWVFFRAESVSRAVHICLGVCRISGSHMRQLLEMGLGRTDVIVLVIAIAVLIVADLLHEKRDFLYCMAFAKKNRCQVRSVSGCLYGASFCRWWQISDNLRQAFCIFQF